MILKDIPSGSSVFIDANIFVYYFSPHATFGPPCQDFIDRVDNQDLAGFTSAHVVANVVHRLMTLEVHRTQGRTLVGMAGWLKRHPAVVQQLSRHRQALDEISAIGIGILPISGRLVSLASDVSKQTGLLLEDALVVTVMRDQGLSDLASNDSDFDRVPDVTRYAPS